MEGAMLMEEGFWHEAERVLSYASNARPKNRVLKYRRALCLHRIGEDWPETVATLQEVVSAPLTLRYDPFNPKQRLPPVDAWLWLASAEHRVGNFEAARNHVKSFLAKAGEKNGATEWATEILEKIKFAEEKLAHPTEALVSSMNANSEADEAHPVVTADGQSMFFSSNRDCSDRSGERRIDPNSEEQFLDVYKMHLGTDSIWSAPEHLDVGIRQHAKVVGVDAFGQQLLLLDDDGWTQQLKMSQSWERGWTVAEPMNFGKTIPNGGEVAFFPQRSCLIASIHRRRGEGGFDLYETCLDDKGKWSKLVALGDEINTRGDEISPFVAADCQTLYFSSDGLEGMGGFDIYRTTKNETGGWTEPEHLGSPINSVNDDLSFSVGVGGKVGYFASRRDISRGDLQLYQVEVQGGIGSPARAVVLRLDAAAMDKTDQPDALVVRDPETGEILKRIEKELSEDVFNLILLVGRDYTVNSEHTELDANLTLNRILGPFSRRLSLPQDLSPGVIELSFEDVFQVHEVEEAESDHHARQDFAFVVESPESASTRHSAGGGITSPNDNGARADQESGTSNLSDSDGNPHAPSPSDASGRGVETLEHEEVTNKGEANGWPTFVQIERDPVKEGSTFTLDAIQFETGRAELSSNEQVDCERLAQWMLDNPGVAIRIEGHTDNVGSLAFNMALSRDRASAVLDFLVTRGVANSRLAIEGKGPLEPRGDNRTEAGRALNRRVQVVIVEPR